MTLPESTLATLNAGMDALQQDATRRNVQDYLDSKEMETITVGLAQKVLQQTNETIAAAIEKNVNGGVRAVRAEVAQMRSDLEVHNEKHSTDVLIIQGDIRWLKYIGGAFCSAAGLLALKSLGL